MYTGYLNSLYILILFSDPNSIVIMRVYSIISVFVRCFEVPHGFGRLLIVGSLCGLRC